MKLRTRLPNASGPSSSSSALPSSGLHLLDGLSLADDLPCLLCLGAPRSSRAPDAFPVACVRLPLASTSNTGIRNSGSGERCELLRDPGMLGRNGSRRMTLSSSWWREKSRMLSCEPRLMWPCESAESCDGRPEDGCSLNMGAAKSSSMSETSGRTVVSKLSFSPSTIRHDPSTGGWRRREVMSGWLAGCLGPGKDRLGSGAKSSRGEES